VLPSSGGQKPSWHALIPGIVPVPYVEENSGLRSAVSGAASGELICSPRCAAKLAQRLRVFSSSRSVTGETMTLTPRERDIVSLIDQGLSNREISDVSIELSTVKNAKLHVHRRTEAAASVGGRLRRRDGSAGSSVLRRA
jgi:two-component system, NarL family, nitrate/nitrite response regulator NarL